MEVAVEEAFAIRVCCLEESIVFVLLLTVDSEVDVSDDKALLSN